MKIIGCDFHPSFQQIAMVDTETGEHSERRLNREEAIVFYHGLCGPAVIGMEACGNTLWLERLLADLGHELKMGDASKIRAMEVRKQKTDRRDAELLLKLLLENRFPQVWVPSVEQRDTRQLLLHRHKLVSVRRSSVAGNGRRRIRQRFRGEQLLQETIQNEANGVPRLSCANSLMRHGARCSLGVLRLYRAPASPGVA